MKQLMIAVSLILILTGPAFGMGWLGGHGGGSQNNTGTAVTSGNDNKSGNTEGGTVTMSGSMSGSETSTGFQSASVSVPEPASIILLVFSGALIFYVRRKFKA